MNIEVKPHRSWNNQWWWWAFSSSEFGGLDPAPVFYLDKGGLFQQINATHHGGYYADAIDTDTWTRLDTLVTTNAKWITLTHSSPLPAGLIHFSIYPMYPNSRAERLVGEWLLNAKVTPTVSGNVNGVIGAMTGRSNGLEGKTAPALNLYGIKISSLSENTKNHMVLTARNHGGETMGSFALEGAVNWLIGGGEEANILLDWCDIWVYPNIAAQAVWGGYYRSSPQQPTLNHNRIWQAVAGQNEDVDVVRAAMTADLGGSVDISMDFHGSSSNIYHYADVADHTGGIYPNFEAIMQTIEDANFAIHDNLPTSSMQAYIAATYNPLVCMTVEAEPITSLDIPGAWKTYGQHLMETVYQLLSSGLLPHHP